MCGSGGKRTLVSGRYARRMPKSSASSFLWVPGQGPDAVALDRMAKAFAKPKNPMGEAWFIGEVREMYPELLGDLDQLTDEQIYKPLEELARGISSFWQLALRI